LDFRILGPLEVLDEGRAVPLGGARQRALLAVLLLHANETVSTDRLIEDVWGGASVATAAKTVQVHVSRLRKALPGGGEVLVTRERGYQLQVDPERLDANRFERLLGEARAEQAAGRPDGAAARLEEGLGLWRGEPLADLAYEPFAQAETARLTDLRAGAQELQIEAKLALGSHAEVIAPLEALIEEHPFRENLRAQLMLALYRSDRQAEALQAYQDARRRLVEELGIEPGEHLRELERAVLAQDASLALPVGEPSPASAPPEPAEPPEPPPPAPLEPGGARRRVSIVFADLVGSTGLGERLDPESMHAVLDRYTALCGSIIERHGGSVEGFIGDAVVGVFGLSELHEDDALRAVRTAVEMRAAGAELSGELERQWGVGIGMKFGVESGEVFLRAGARRSPFAAGDAFNVASRLEGLAPAGQIFIGENTYPLVRDSVRVTRLEPLELKGRTAKVQAWQLLELEPDDGLPPTARPFVGRRRELEDLHGAFARARQERGCRVVTVVGPAGMGKSRLARELIGELGDEATVAIGRCASYGEDVAYRPLAEIVGSLGAGDPRERVGELLDGDAQKTRLVLGAIGLAESGAQPEETFLAVRRLLERAASERPLLLIVEDVHWAEPTLLDLLEYVAAFSSGEPILILCLARPDFADLRPGWVTPQPGRSLLVLEALSGAEAVELAESAATESLGPQTTARIVETAEGNPLFIEQLVAVGAESAESLPSSIHAVLAARIDQLAPGERAVLELASVQGRSFYVRGLEELAGDAEVSAHLVALVRHQLIRSERSEVPGEDAFRFGHALIRETAYQGLPKQRRAELHERVAHWLASSPGSSDEAIGHHLAEAYELLAGLAPVGEHERDLARAASERLEAAADAALRRGDGPAVASLLKRAAGLIEAGDPARAALLPRLGAALLDAGRLAEAEDVLTEAIELAPHDSPLAARARVERELVRLQSGADTSPQSAELVVDSALRVLELDGDELGQSRAHFLRALRAWVEGRCGQSDEELESAVLHARRAGHEAGVFELLAWRASAALFGPTPVPEAIRRCEEIREQVAPSPVAVARTLQPLAALHAMAGDFEEARRLVAEGDEILGELVDLQSAVSQQEALVEMLAGEPAAAEARLRSGYEQLVEMGEKALLASTSAMLAQALYAQGRFDEASELCAVSEEVAADEDLTAQVSWRGVRAKLLAPADWEQAHRLATEGVAIAERTDFETVQADALIDLAEVCLAGDRPDEAGTAVERALAVLERKGDVASAARARALIPA
jgi:class 3 adenylate cyclase/DNA-binding SARP family transcriptional activator